MMLTSFAKVLLYYLDSFHLQIDFSCPNIVSMKTKIVSIENVARVSLEPIQQKKLKSHSRTQQLSYFTIEKTI